MSSDYLFATPSFVRGLGRTFDPWGTPEPYNWSRTPEEADTLAMYVDWVQVGQDLAKAIEHFAAPNASHLRAAEPRQLDLFDGDDGPKEP